MFTRGLFAVLALAFTGAGLVGAALPGLPTVPFLLVAVACGRRGWPGLSSRLESHPRWGAPLRDWRRHGAVSRRAKWLATSMMAVSFAALAVSGLNAGGLVLLGLVLAGVLAWLWWRPEGSGERRRECGCESAG